MNIQIERREDHTAKLVVEVDAERLDQAKREAARALSTKVNIPGFRKGKAPYRMLVNYIGEEYITEEAIEKLSEKMYPEIIDQVDFQPYSSGVLNDYDVTQETPTLTFVVPLAPEVDLVNYRDTRVDYEAPAVTEDMIEQALRNLREEHAVVEDSQHAARLGDRVTFDIHSFFIEEAEEAVADEAAESEVVDAADAELEDADPDDIEHYVDPTRGDPYIHEHDMRVLLNDDDELLPGFNDNLAGANIGDTLTFTLTIPDDAEAYEADEIGRTVEFIIDLKKVENITLPELNDELAARATAEEETPLTLLELRVRIRENLERMTSTEYDNSYARRALDSVIEQAVINFPEAIVVDEVNALLQDLDQRLRNQNFTLEDYMKIYGKSIDDMYTDYRDTAVLRVKRGLVLRELVQAEQVKVQDADIDAEIARLAESFGAEEQQEQFRQMFAQQPSMRASMQDDLLMNKVMERVAEIAKGTAPELTAPVENTPAESAPAESMPADADTDNANSPAADQPPAANDETDSTEETA